MTELEAKNFINNIFKIKNRTFRNRLLKDFTSLGACYNMIIMNYGLEGVTTDEILVKYDKCQMFYSVEEWKFSGKCCYHN